MKCKDCEYFKVLFDPIKNYDYGKAICKKYPDIRVEFMTYRHLNKLMCYENKKENRNDRIERNI